MSVRRAARPRWAARLVAITLVLSLAGVSGTGRSSAATTVGSDGKPITNAKGVTFGVQGHRGGLAEAPENSVEAFQHSVDMGFDGIEVDLLFTKDALAVMNHEDYLTSRCTRPGEKRKRIHELTLAQLDLIRCKDLAGGYTVPIATFTQFAKILKPSDLKIALEVKSYSGQSASSKKTYLKRTINLLKKHKLLDRTRIITFYWDAVLPTIRKYAPKIHVQAMDNAPLDLDRVRLAAKLGATSYANRHRYTSLYLLRYIKAKGISAGAWDAVTADQRALSIHFAAGPTVLFTSDTPTVTRQNLIAGGINLNPVPTYVTTTLPKQIKIAKKANYAANKRKYKTVLGVAVPSDRISMLDSVTLQVTVTKGPGKGYLDIGPASGRLRDGVRVKLPKGTKKLTVKVPLGDKGRIRIFTSVKATLTVMATGYTHMDF